jgi:hypothetical protein
MRIVLLAVMVAACGVPPQPPPLDDQRLDLNDVSYLFPLSHDGLLGFTSSGPKGALLTRAFFDQVKKVDEVISADEIFSGMRVISARVDPCFPINKPPEPLQCKKQIRLVAQVIEDGTEGITTRDGTIHLFFDLSDAEWTQVVDRVKALKAIAKDQTASKPLDVHPVMKAQGVTGEYATKLKALITDFCGEQNLSRVAFMVAGMDGKNWNFGAFNRNLLSLEADKIPRTDDKEEQAQQEHGVETRRNTEMIPTPPNIDLTTLLSNTELQLADDLTLTRAATEALKIENPKKETPQTIDCASCHVASRALTNAVSVRMLDLSSITDRYPAPMGFDLRRIDTVGNNPFAQRAFGYFKNQTAFSQRTINESAAIAEAMAK